jgi:hypothetical protein
MFWCLSVDCTVTLTVLTDIPFWALYNSGLTTTLVVVTEDWMMKFLGLPEMTTRLMEVCWKLQDSYRIASILLVSCTTYLIDKIVLCHIRRRSVDRNLERKWNQEIVNQFPSFLRNKCGQQQNILRATGNIDLPRRMKDLYTLDSDVLPRVVDYIRQ